MTLTETACSCDAPPHTETREPRNHYRGADWESFAERARASRPTDAQQTRVFIDRAASGYLTALDQPAPAPSVREIVKIRKVRFYSTT